MTPRDTCNETRLDLGTWAEFTEAKQLFLAKLDAQSQQYRRTLGVGRTDPSVNQTAAEPHDLDSGGNRLRT